jgi:FkbM family methyltransferase
MTRTNLFRRVGDGLRGLAWRAGRRVYCMARGDFLNRPETNGEYWLLDRFLESAGGGAVFLDVGANVGDWTLRALESASRAGVSIRVHAFEPSAGTRDLLERRLSGRGAVQVDPRALAASEGEADFFSNAVGSGTNSLSALSGETVERVRTTTLDAFVVENGLRNVGLLKIDAEGFDFEVLKGGERTLAAGLVEVAQFEYNGQWLVNHRALRDVFEYLRGKPYRFGKLAGRSIELYAEWHPELDRFFENNYVLIRNGSPLLEGARPMRFDLSNCARGEEDAR